MRLQKNTNLFLVSFHAMITTFTAAAVIPVFEDFAIEFSISITSASYLTSIQILILGLSPLFWKPISNRYGRRPIWLISTLLSMVCNIGNAKANSYGSQVALRLLVAFFISPAIAISSVVVIETFFARERAQKMGIWTLMVTLGSASCLLLFS
jgi:MFS family permease